MSSMTDIVFLLLIFFMLTSTLVTVNALDILLPKAQGKTENNKINDKLSNHQNNQVKPECCDASYASDTGCVCTTPQQRNYINMRGGNRTVEDGV